MAKEQKKEQAPKEQKEQQQTVAEVKFADAVPAIVKEVVGRTGTRGDCVQVRCHIQEGWDKGKIIRRNVRGPIKVGDVLMLTETEIEAQKLNTGRRG